MKTEFLVMKTKQDTIEKKVQQLDSYSRRENIIVDGLVEPENENCFETAKQLFTNMGLDNFPLQRCHRLFRKDREGKKPRPLIIRFISFQDKLQVIRNAKVLKGKDVYIQDDYPPEISAQRARLRPFVNTSGDRMKMSG